ncbi:hypothetical protein NDU88_006829 [Pleurodeles waltl]|uniref:Uncharacterized protein n=1 Tax=Pleurodeles waltl TaxID=8319 RepID=A0AAV7RQK3_PLEWA|nr:hypothetical protein NDU88_006829 [Pleurodeles waltl]
MSVSSTGPSSASGLGVGSGVSSGVSQGPDICLGVVRSSPPSRPAPAAGFLPIRVGPRVGAATALLRVVRSALTVSWVSVVRIFCRLWKELSLERPFTSPSWPRPPK